MAGALHIVHYSLDVDAHRYRHTVADDNGEDGGQVNAVSGFGAFGVDGAAELEQDFGSGGDGEGLLCGSWRGSGGGRWLSCRRNGRRGRSGRLLCESRLCE